MGETYFIELDGEHRSLVVNEKGVFEHTDIVFTDVYEVTMIELTDGQAWKLCKALLRLLLKYKLKWN